MLRLSLRECVRQLRPVLSLALTSAGDGPGGCENQAADSGLRLFVFYFILYQMPTIHSLAVASHTESVSDPVLSHNSRRRTLRAENSCRGTSALLVQPVLRIERHSHDLAGPLGRDGWRVSSVRVHALDVGDFAQHTFPAAPADFESAHGADIGSGG